MNSLEIKAALKIQKPVHDVFEAIVDPMKMSGYFIAESTGRLEEGKTVMWRFPEMDMEFPVSVRHIEKDKFISWAWNDFRDQIETTVGISLTAKPNSSTFVEITEKSRPNDDTGIAWLKSNTEGWANFLACLKAYLEYGINLRKNAFEISQMPV